jgi:hypothetical protein
MSRARPIVAAVRRSLSIPRITRLKVKSIDAMHGRVVGISRFAQLLRREVTYLGRER